ncbi:MAG: hypothetical protein OXH94_15870 [Rhodospirillales bacterium]|nr:hypothetical protein [Rhodospirillales bacterium]
MSKFWSRENPFPPPEEMGLVRYVIRYGFFSYWVGFFAFAMLMLHAVWDAMGWMEISLFQVALYAGLYSLGWGIVSIYKFYYQDNFESPLFDSQKNQPED